MTPLEELNKRVSDDLQTLGYGKPTWVRQRKDVYDVVIVGGGQSGLGAAYGLIREVSVISLSLMKTVRVRKARGIPMPA